MGSVMPALINASASLQRGRGVPRTPFFFLLEGLPGVDQAPVHLLRVDVQDDGLGHARHLSRTTAHINGVAAKSVRASRRRNKNKTQTGQRGPGASWVACFNTY